VNNIFYLRNLRIFLLLFAFVLSGIQTEEREPSSCIQTPPVPSPTTTIFPPPVCVPMPAYVTARRKFSKPTKVSQHYLDLFENEFTQKSQAGFKGVRFKCLSIIKDAIARCAQNAALSDQLSALQGQIADLFQRHSQYKRTII